MAYTINRMASGAGNDDVDSRARKALAEHAELTAVAGKVRDLLARAVSAI